MTESIMDPHLQYAVRYMFTGKLYTLHQKYRFKKEILPADLLRDAEREQKSKHCKF